MRPMMDSHSHVQAVGAENPKLVGLWLQTAIVFALLGAIPVMLWYLCVGHLIALTMDDAETVAYGQSFAQVLYSTCEPFFL